MAHGLRLLSTQNVLKYELGMFNLISINYEFLSGIN